MSKKYLLVELNKQSEFRADFTASLLGINIESSLKIDTGAVRSLIPLKSVYFSDRCDLDADDDLYKGDFYKNLKKSYIDSGEKYGFMRGIERVDYPKETPILDRRDIVFNKQLDNLVLCGYNIIDTFNIAVNCDTNGNILLGMDILQLFDFHCGYSNKLDSFVFIGVLKSQEDKSDYYRALEKHFGIVTSCKDLLYYDFLEDEKRKNEASGFFNWLTRKFGGSNEKDK